jgi:serine protease Do
MKKHLTDLKMPAAIALAVLFSLPLSLGAKVLPMNEKKVPETMADLVEIQDALVDSLPRARKATVSISLGKGFGSGVIVSPDGLVLTAAHVTAGVDKELTVILNDGTELKAVSMGLVSDTDAAMMRIMEEGEYPYVEINRDNDYKLGHWIFALGHSSGFDKERGPVVRLGRILKDGETTLQTDCKVIGGDSGGPLFDLGGQLIGIHSRVSKSMEENMHVPMREYLKHWDEMVENKFLGNGPFAKRPVKGTGFLGFGSSDTDDGVVVGKVWKDGPADKAGIKVGDIVLEIDGRKIPDKAVMKTILMEKAVGDQLVIMISRKGEEQEIEVKLGKR